MQQAFVAHLRHVARLYQAKEYQRVVLIIDNTPWNRVGPLDEAPTDCPQLEFYWLPNHGPQLNVIEPFRKVRRRRATRNRLFEGLADLKRSIRANLCSDQTMRGRVRSLIAGCDMPARKKDSITGCVNQRISPPRGKVHSERAGQ
jgi:hypothetical protein